MDGNSYPVKRLSKGSDSKTPSSIRTGSKSSPRTTRRSSSPRTPNSLLCKVLVVGNAKCGKTSIIRRFASDAFDESYNTTVGADFVRRDLELPAEAGRPKTQMRMQLWDIAGQDRFARLTRAYFRRAKAAVVVCDLTREGTFAAVRQWKKELDKFAKAEGGAGGGGEPLPVVLFANKSDLLQDVAASFVAGAKMEALCRELGFVAWFVSSAKDGCNVEQGFRHLAALVAGKEAASSGGGGGAGSSRARRERTGGRRRFKGDASTLLLYEHYDAKEDVAPAPDSPASSEGKEHHRLSDEARLLQVWDLDDF